MVPNTVSPMASSSKMLDYSLEPFLFSMDPSRACTQHAKISEFALTGGNGLLDNLGFGTPPISTGTALFVCTFYSIKQHFLELS